MIVQEVDERTTRDVLPAERDRAIALTLEAYQQYDAVMPPGAWPSYAASIDATLRDAASGQVIVAVEHKVLVGHQQPTATAGQSS